MKMKITEIYFDPPHESVIFTGQKVTGQVVVSSDRNVNIKDIYFRLIGNGEVKWIELNKKLRARYFDNENYISLRVPLSHEECPAINTGINKFPFSFTLDENLPSSYSSEHGWINYKIIASVDKHFGDDIPKYKLPLTVQSILDLNLHPTAKVGLNNEDSLNDLCCLFCNSGTIRLSVHILKSGFVPGENMDIVMEVDNSSSGEINIKGITQQYVTYHADKDEMTEINEINAMELLEKVEQANFKIIERSIPIPELPSEDLGGNSKLIKIKYKYKVYAEPSGCSKPIVLVLPIVIGTVPVIST